MTLATTIADLFRDGVSYGDSLHSRLSQAFLSLFTNPTITNYTEAVYAPAAGAALVVDLSNGTRQRLVTNANATITLPASVDGKSYVVEVHYGGVHSLTWAGGGVLRWPASTEPTETSVNAKVDIFSFFCDGTNTFGATIGQAY
jgi:hypothetical protein